MMTQNFSYSRILAVWLVLLAFFCGMILPSIAIARMEFTIATEGDPTDGLDYSGGGGGGGGGGSSDGGNQSSSPLEVETHPICYFPQFFSGNFVIFPIWENGKLIINIIHIPQNECLRGNYQ